MIKYDWHKISWGGRRHTGPIGISTVLVHINPGERPALGQCKFSQHTGFSANGGGGVGVYAAATAINLTV